ncbi:MAG TPA: acyl-CoA dehydrogenase family protein [Terracidiphilus sp.]
MGIALGIARHALDEITAQAVQKAQFSTFSAVDTSTISICTRQDRARARSCACPRPANLVWDLGSGAAGEMPPPEQQAQARAAAAYVTEIAQGVTTVAFQAAGGGALFDTNPLQRCFRDVYAAGQHFLVSQSSYRALGQFKLRQPDANPML